MVMDVVEGMTLPGDSGNVEGAVLYTDGSVV